MGVLGCLQFAVKFFLDFLAWPLLALGYPLCASIKAIETNSVSDTQKLNTYWVVFSLILLFEHASVKLLQWFSFWPYIRLSIVCLLVIPYFDGASYVYKHLFCYCLSLDPQIVINWFHKWMESSFKRQKLLAEVERFVKENGTEALEKLIASKSDGTNKLEVEEIKAVSSIENKLVSKVNQVEPNLVWTKNQIVASEGSKKPVPEIAVGRQELLQISVSKPVQKERMYENLIIATGETEESLPEIAVGREELPQTSASKPVQKEWTCNICNLTTQSELVFNSHLQGKKHNNKVVREAMKAKNETVLSEKIEAKEAMKAKKETILSEKTEVKEAMKAKKETVLSEKIEVKEARKAKKEVVLSEKTEVKEAMKAKNEEVKEAMKAKNETVLSEKTKVKEAIKAKNETVLSEKTEVKEAMKAKNEEVKEAMKVKKETVLSEKIEAKEAMKAKKETILSEKTEVKEAMKAKNEEVKEAMKAKKETVLSEKTEVKEAMKAKKEAVLSEKTEVKEAMKAKNEEVKEAMKAKNETVLSEKTEVKEAMKAKNETVLSEKIEVKEAMKAKNGTVLSEKTEVNKSKAIPCYENKGVTQSNLNEPDVERKHLKPVVVLEKNEVTTVSQVSQAEPNIVQTEKQIIATVETKETITDVAPRRELPQTSTSKPVQREWTCCICNLTVLCETVFNSHLQGKKHKKAVLKEEMKVKNQTVVPSYTQKKSDSPNEEPVSSSKNQTVLPKVVPSYIPKKSDLPDEEPGNSTKNHTVLPKVVYVPKKSDSPNEKPGNSLKNQTVLPEVFSSYTPKKSDQPSVEHANTSKDQTIQPNVGLSYIQKKSDWITIIEASGWDVPCETWQSKPKNISASTAAKKPSECKEEKVQGQQQKNQNKETVAQNDPSLYCSLCNVSYTNKLDMASHLRGRRHLIQVQTSSGV